MKKEIEQIRIKTEYIKLDQFLKWVQLTESGGEAKDAILAGAVLVNGETETKRGKKLRNGDLVEVLLEDGGSVLFQVVGHTEK